MQRILPPPVPVQLFICSGIRFIEWISGSCLTNSPVFWNKADCSFQSAAGSVSEPTQHLWQGGKCVGECKFEAMCLGKADGEGGGGGWGGGRGGAHVERGETGWRTAGDRQTLIVMALISASLALSFHMGSDILLLLHPLHLVRGCWELAGLCSPLERKEAAKHRSPHI